jgi:hypothetical protein
MSKQLSRLRRSRTQPDPRATRRGATMSDDAFGSGQPTKPSDAMAALDQ